MNDEAYLEKAGIDAQTGGPIQEKPSAPSSPETSQTQSEMFELGGNKYPVNSEFQILHNGQMQKVPYQNLVNTYRQASHIHGKWDEARKQMDERKDYDKFKGFYDKYGALQEWSDKNPKDWETLHSLWQNKDRHLLEARTQGAAQGQPHEQFKPFIDEISSLKSSLNELMPVINEFKAEKAERAEAQDVNFIKEQIGSFQKDFKEVDLQEKDPDGLPLWAKVVQWGHSNGYADFEAAAHVYLKSRIADVYQNRARTEAMKGVKQDHQNGIIKRSATPITQGQGQAQGGYKKGMSWNDLTQMSKEQIGSMG